MAEAEISGQLPSGSGWSSRPSHGRRVDPLRPAWPSCIPIFALETAALATNTTEFDGKQVAPGQLLDACKADPILGRKLFQIEFLTTLSGQALITLCYHRPLDDSWDAPALALAEQLGVQLIGRSRGQKRVLQTDHVVEVLEVAGRQWQYDAGASRMSRCCLSQQACRQSDYGAHGRVDEAAVGCGMREDLSDSGVRIRSRSRASPEPTSSAGLAGVPARTLPVAPVCSQLGAAREYPSQPQGELYECAY